MSFASVSAVCIAALTALTLGGPASAKSATPHPHAHQAEVALTIDDMPALMLDDTPSMTLRQRQAYIDDYMQRLTRGLVRHHVHAIGFVNAGKFEAGIASQQKRVLTRWLAAGLDLGNHTYSHETPETLGAKGYVQDIAHGETWLRPMMAHYGRSLTWFRHPYLKTGATAQTRATIENWLAKHGYRVAPVTMDADDWLFAECYDHALEHGDTALAAHIRHDYLQFARARITWFRQASQLLFHRDISYIFLMHATRLNADVLDAYLAMLKRQGLHTVSLERAMRDRAYRSPDRFLSAKGTDWLSRWAQTRGIDIPKDEPEAPADLERLYHRIDPDT
ncbi:polysaccharide deacetylase family protein [Novosphingobium sp. FSY-8]|uniref:Chitooligosaccharide deacetylase n=1 Tax=Novosphingobium ovatum TaxID=1908523 RepID=A0ABW9XA09_9SPHN|nr:polysaccharide deacetylase family protein [Novosphingobium ovatum]NBC35367.1 polysaccharide deacetylase family protein [Novosphingobium ovatum]